MIKILIMDDNTSGIREAAALLEGDGDFDGVWSAAPDSETDLILIGASNERRMIEALSAASNVGVKSAVVGQNGELQEAAFLNGASYFFIFPFDEQLFLKRLREMVSGGGRASQDEEMVFPHRSRIERLLDWLGMSRKLLGYEYLVIAISLLAQNRELMKRLTTQVYPMIARMKGTRAACVERAMRHGVESVWTKGRLSAINELFGYSIATDKGKPTNGEFISRLSDIIALGTDGNVSAF